MQKMNESSWQPIVACKNEMSSLEWEWLHHIGSLTVRLRTLTEGRIQHVLQQEGWAEPIIEERIALQMFDTHAWMREIDWVYQGQLWVQARVVIPEATLQINGGKLNQIKQQSLGDVIFQDPTLTRQTLEVRHIAKTHLYYQCVLSSVKSLPNKLWSRRSVFLYHQQPLLVIETLLPPIYQFDFHEHV